MRLAPWALLGLLPFFTGCPSNDLDSKYQQLTDTVVQDADQDHLGQAIDLLARGDEVGSRQVNERVLFDLNEWLAKEKEDPSWVADPLFARLPAEYAVPGQGQDLSELQFNLLDVGALREAIWLRDRATALARSARDEDHLRRTLGPDRVQWLNATEGRYGPDAADHLRFACLAFDWVVRNLPLDPPPAAAAPGVADEKTAFPRPGARYFAFENLLYGHADALERAKVFVRLLRQRSIDAVCLYPDEAPTGVAWPVAVVLRTKTPGAANSTLELFVFDTVLGLPIPAADANEPASDENDPEASRAAYPGIATLAEFVADGVPDKLAAAAGVEYPLSAEQRGRLVAWIDAPRSSLTQRMRLVERSLAGERRVRLTTTPSRLAKELRSMADAQASPSGAGPPIRDVRLWPAEYATLGFRIRLEQIRNEWQAARADGETLIQNRLEEQHDTDFAERLEVEQRLFHPASPLARGRVMHLRGRLDETLELPGARALYVESRPPARDIDELRTNQDLIDKRIRAGLLPKDRKDRLQFLEQLEFGKATATFWLGLLAYETGNYKVAADFFGDRLLKANEPEPDPQANQPGAPSARAEERWMAGARYNLARCYEAESYPAELPTADPAELQTRAANLLRQTTGPQERGNRLRAELLPLADPPGA